LCDLCDRRERPPQPQASSIFGKPAIIDASN
jgi:hypothetical protein